MVQVTSKIQKKLTKCCLSYLVCGARCNSCVSLVQRDIPTCPGLLDPRTLTDIAAPEHPRDYLPTPWHACVWPMCLRRLPAVFFGSSWHNALVMAQSNILWTIKTNKVPPDSMIVGFDLALRQDSYNIILTFTHEGKLLSVIFADGGEGCESIF